MAGGGTRDGRREAAGPESGRRGGLSHHYLGGVLNSVVAIDAAAGLS